jgi:2'-5' RNA ligase
VAGRLALWLVPDEPVRSRLDALIARWAERMGAPRFAPHVTLLSGLALPLSEALAPVVEAAARSTAVPVAFPRAAHSGEYYRCVFLDAEPTPELLGIHQRARRVLRRGPDRFRPHLSLVYGRFEEARRSELAGEAERELALPLRATAGRLELHETGGAPARWRRVAWFDLAR